MKKYLCLIVLLLITVPAIWAMEITNKDNTDNSKVLSIQVQELCELFSIQPEETFGFSSASSQEFLDKFTNSINEIKNYHKLRQGIFKTMQILALTPQEEKNARIELKTLCKTMYKQLTRFTDTEQTAKKYCYNVLDCLSDDEEENSANSENQNQIRKNFDTYKLIDSSINTINQNKNNIIVNMQQQTPILIGKALEIEKLKEQLKQAEEEFIELKKKEMEDLKEIEAICIASNLLKTGASKQLLKMQKREQDLLKEAQEQHSLIKQLQEEKSQLDSISIEDRTDNDTNKFINKIIELSNAHKKSMEIKIELSYVTKYLHDAKEQTGIQKTLKNLAWNLNLYNYPSSISLKKD